MIERRGFLLALAGMAAWRPTRLPYERPTIVAAQLPLERPIAFQGAQEAFYRPEWFSWGAGGYLFTRDRCWEVVDSDKGGVSESKDPEEAT